MKIRSHKQFDLLYRQLSPHDKDLVRSTLEFFVEDPFHPSLRTHALRGELIGYWSLSVDRDLRVLFSEQGSFTEVILIKVGDHKTVYQTPVFMK